MKFLGTLIVALFSATLILALVPAGSLMGAFAGWVLSKIFVGDWILSALKALGIQSMDLVDLGALLGFAGAFFSTSVKTNTRG